MIDTDSLQAGDLDEALDKAFQVARILTGKRSPEDTVPAKWRALLQTAQELDDLERQMCDLRSEQVLAWKKLQAALYNVTH